MAVIAKKEMQTRRSWVAIGSPSRTTCPGSVPFPAKILLGKRKRQLHSADNQNRNDYAYCLGKHSSGCGAGCTPSKYANEKKIPDNVGNTGNGYRNQRELCVANPPEDAAQYVEGDDKKSSRAQIRIYSTVLIKASCGACIIRAKGTANRFQH